MDWIKIDLEKDYNTIPPQYKEVLVYDTRDGKQKRAKLLHGLYGYGYYYELEGLLFQDTAHNLTHWKEFDPKPLEYLTQEKEEQERRDNQFFKDLFNE